MYCGVNNRSTILFLYILHLSIRFGNAVHGHAYVRRNGLAARREQEAMDEEEELEKELEAEEDYEDDGEIANILSVSAEEENAFNNQNAKESTNLQDNNKTMSERRLLTNHLPPPKIYAQQHYGSVENSHAHIVAMPGLNKETVFEQGETRDFLRFLRRIQYDHRQFPVNEETGDEPVIVAVSVVVSNIRAVSEVTMDYSLEMFYRESWQDKRLIYSKAKFKNKSELALHESYANFLWHPDTFMPNAIASKNPRKQSVSHRSLLRLQSDGNVLYSRRLSVVAECPMDLTLFPFDSQVCKLGIESYGYTADQVRYSWSHGIREALTLQKIRLPDFRIKEAFVTNQIENYATGNYSRLYICFVFTRSAGFCFLQLIIPSTAVVITSWVSMWMENETSFQDMISIILTILLLTFSYNEVMPRVSYLKALDIWLAVCFMVVFLSLIKLAICKYIRQRLQITQDTSIVADMIPLVRLAATNGINLNDLQRKPSQYRLNRQNSIRQNFRQSLTLQNKTTLRPSNKSNNRLLTRSSSMLSSKNANYSSKPTTTMPNRQIRAVSIAQTIGSRFSQSTNNKADRLDTGWKRKRPSTPPPASTALQSAQRVSQQQFCDNNNNQSEIDTQEMQDMSSTYSRSGRTALQYRTTNCVKTPTICDNVNINTAIQQLSGNIGQIIAHQALSKSNMAQSHLLNTPSDTLGQFSLSRSILQQMQQRHELEQQQLQTRIQTQLLQAQAQSYLRQKSDEQRRRQRRSRRKRDSAIPDTIITSLDQDHKDPCMLDVEQGHNHSHHPDDYYDVPYTDNIDAKEQQRDFSINFSDSVDSGFTTKGRFLHCMDRIGNVEFSAQFLNRFHWISQMTFFFCFVIFCFFFFLVYPNIRVPILDPACVREEAEWFAAL